MSWGGTRYDRDVVDPVYGPRSHVAQVTVCAFVRGSRCSWMFGGLLTVAQS